MTVRCFLMMMLAAVIGFSLGTRDVRAYAFLDCGERLETLTPCPSEPGVAALPEGFPAGLSDTDTPDHTGGGHYVTLALLPVNGPSASAPDAEAPVPPSIVPLSSNSGPRQALIPTDLPDRLGPEHPEAGSSDQHGSEEKEHPIPEPATMVLLGISMISLASYGRFRMKN